MLFVVSQQDQPEGANRTHECETQVAAGESIYLVVDCTKQRIKNGLIPQDLDEGIRGLDISYNKIQPLDADSFKRYKSLVVLNITFMDVFNVTTAPKEKTREGTRSVVKIDYNTFQPLMKLESLDLTHSFCGSQSGFYLPPMLSSVSFAALYLTKDMNFENLHYLQAVNLYANELKSFPKFYKKFPQIKWIVLFENPLESLTVEDIAPLCSLNRLEIDAKNEDSNLDKEPFFCHCKRLIKWLIDFDIAGHEGFSCFPSNKECSMTFDKRLLQTREKCLARIKTGTEGPEEAGPVGNGNGTSAITPRPPPPTPTPPSKFKMNVSTLLLILFFVLSVAFIIYISYQLYQRQGSSESLEVAEELEEEELEELEEEEE